MSSSTADGSLVRDCSPLLEPSRMELPIARQGDRLIRGADFLAAAAEVAGRLPERRYVVNLCTNRYRFLLGFAAAIARGQTNLLPPNRADATLRMLRAEYPDSYALVDSDTPAADFEAVHVGAAAGSAGIRSALNPPIDAGHVAAIVFTSGSTGGPQPVPKTWKIFCRSVDLIAAHLGIRHSRAYSTLATVPPQHMYGLETTILLPMRTGNVLADLPVFYPSDIHRALQELPRPRMLVTTPLHLRACLESGEKMPPADLIVSATAPLSGAMAREAEALFDGQLLEIFGFTEAGSVAVRRTACTEDFEWFRGLEFLRREGAPLLTVPYLPQPVSLHDGIEPLDRRHFRLLGRFAEQVNIAGKRTSIAALNAALCGISGVQDGVFFMPERADDVKGIPRLTAFVVAPTLTSAEVLAALRERIDPAFIPRPLCLVDSLPRQGNGKLAREDLERLAGLCRKRTMAGHP